MHEDIQGGWLRQEKGVGVGLEEGQGLRAEKGMVLRFYMIGAEDGERDGAEIGGLGLRVEKGWCQDWRKDRG